MRYWVYIPQQSPIDETWYSARRYLSCSRLASATSTTSPGWRSALNGKRIFIVNKTQVRLRSVSSHLLAEPVILARMAETIFGHNQAVGWKAMVE